MNIVGFITAKDKEEAQKIADVLVLEKLVACVNIVPSVQSVFWWEGKVDNSEEVLMIFKSRKDLFERIVSSVKSAHSYTVPEIIALPVIDGNQDYLKWVKESTT